MVPRRGLIPTVPLGRSPRFRAEAIAVYVEQEENSTAYARR